MKRADKPFAFATRRCLTGLFLVMALLLSCERDFEAPPLTEPAYSGADANLSIASLKSMYAAISDPTLIDVDYIIKATVIGNDISGNIYKQIYIQDETGGINMGVDQNSIFTEYRVGQEIYVHLKGLYMVMYGGQLQIGYGQTNANRIPWEVFNYYVYKNKWPKAENAVPKPITITQLDQSLVNTLVKLENVYFPDGGKLTFSETGATTNRTLMDGDGNTVIVRNSNYAAFSADLLPEGGGNIVAVLSKYNSDYQLYLRSIHDCENFGQPIPSGGGGGTTDPDIITYYKETFGTDDVTSRPKVAGYTGYDNKTVTYSDPSVRVDVRSTATFATPHLWFPSGGEVEPSFVIEGINTASASQTLTLTYELVMNPYNVGEEMNTNAMEVEVDGQQMSVPSQVYTITGTSDRNRVYTINLQGIPAKAGLTIRFTAPIAKNTYGMRLDNISITNAQNVVIITPDS